MLGFLLACYLVWSFLVCSSQAQFSLLSAFVLLLNGGLALTGLILSMGKGFPLFTIFFLFNLLFHGIAPLQQIAEKTSPIFNDADTLLEASLLCVPFTISGLLIVVRRKSLPSHRPRTTRFLEKSLLRYRPQDTLLLFAVNTATTLALLAYYFPVLLTNRQAASNQLAEDASKTGVIILNGLLTPFVLAAALIGLIISYRRSSTLGTAAFGALTVAAAIVNNPLIHARYQSSALIGFTLLAVFGWTRSRLIVYTVLSGISVSPIFNSLFRYNEYRADERSLQNFFAHMDYDAINILCYTLIWVREQGIVFGSNIVGALFFFIPRSVWSDKGQHPALTMFSYLKEYQGYSTDNLSSPPPVEGYLAFGLLGALIFPVLVVASFDWMERRAMTAEEFSPWQLIVCMSTVLTLILLRGPFQVGFSEIVLHSVAIVVVALLLYAGASAALRRR